MSAISLPLSTADRAERTVAAKLGTVLRHEWRTAFADRAVWTSLLVFAALALYALWSGAQWSATRASEAALAERQSVNRNAEFKADLQKYRSGQSAASTKPAWYPGWIAAPTTPDARISLPLRPLAALSSNAGELQPLIANMRLATSRYGVVR